MLRIGMPFGFSVVADLTTMILQTKSRRCDRLSATIGSVIVITHRNYRGGEKSGPTVAAGGGGGLESFSVINHTDQFSN
jgi:hypothetical protein